MLNHHSSHQHYFCKTQNDLLHWSFGCSHRNQDHITQHIHSYINPVLDKRLMQVHKAK